MKKQDYLKHKRYQDKNGTTLLKVFEVTNSKQEMVIAFYERVYRFFYDDKKKDVEFFNQMNKEIDEVIEVFPRFADALDHLANNNEEIKAFVFLRKSKWDDIAYYFMSEEKKKDLYYEQHSKVTHDPEYQTEEEKASVRSWNEKVLDRMKWPSVLSETICVPFHYYGASLRYKTIEDCFDKED